jgi:hypothetical protein
MDYAIMATTFKDLKKNIFEAESVRHIIRSDIAQLAYSYDGSRHFVNYDDMVYEVIGPDTNNRKEGYYLILSSNHAIKIQDYKILKETRKLTGNLVAGTDEDGREHLGIRFSSFAIRGVKMDENLEDAGN